VELKEDDANVLSYLRKSGDYAVLVAINMSSSPQIISFDLSKQGLNAAAVKTLLTTQPSLKDKTSVRQLSLEPFAVTSEW